AVSLVDLAYGCKHLRLEILVRGELGSRRRRNDKHREATAKLRRFLPQAVERTEPLGNSFRVIDAVDADAERAIASRVPLSQGTRRASLSSVNARRSYAATSMLIGKTPRAM